MTEIPSAESLRRAGEILSQIEALSAEMVRLFSGASGAPAAAGASAAAAVPARAANAAPGKPRKAQRNFSPEARARIIRAVKARWARFRAEKQKEKGTETKPAPAAKASKARGKGKAAKDAPKDSAKAPATEGTSAAA